MNEEWRDIPDLAGFYQASSLGRIRRVAAKAYRNTKPGGILSQSFRSPGRAAVWVSVGNVIQRRPVARLVASAFLGPCPKGLTVNHIDGNKENNIPGNFEYITPVENTRHGVSLGLNCFGSKNGNAKINESDVTEILKLVGCGVPRKDIASKLGIGKATIDGIVSGRTWKHVPRKEMA
jgi:hypothetical protein